jgi:arylsulfatase A-like enzyme
MKNTKYTRRRFLKTIGIGLAAANIHALSAGCQRISRKPNVLFIAVDDLNDWVGCMAGHPNVLTPHIDSIAESGTLFLNAHCQAPICGPSRASLMTGLRPSTTGIYGQIKDKDLRRDNPVVQNAVYLSEYFRNHGYKTMGVGKLFHTSDGDGAFQEYGGVFEKYGPKPENRLHYDPAWFNKPGNTSTDWGAFPDSDDKMPDTKSANWAISKLQETHDQPYFLAVGFVRPHVPWHVPQKWFDLFPVDKINPPPYLKNDDHDLPAISRRVADVPMMPTTEWALETRQWNDMVQAYLASTAFVDDKVGMLLKALQESPYADNTIIVLWGDNGYHMGEKNRFAKHSLWDRSTKVPLIIAGSGLPQNQECTRPVGLIDIYPTLLDLCRLPENSRLEGHSLVPLLHHPRAEWRYLAITTYGRNNHALRSDNFRYIRYEDGSEELYNLENDPNEWYNIAGEKKYAEVIGQFKKYLPEKNVPWAKGASNDVNDYFLVDQHAGPDRDK